MEQLVNRRSFEPAPRVFKLFVPATDGCLAIQICGPPRARRRIQIGLHMGPAMALNLEHSRFNGSLQTSLRRYVILLDAEVIRKFLVPWRDDAMGLAIDETRDH